MRFPYSSPAALLAVLFLAAAVAPAADAATTVDGLVVHRGRFLLNPTVQIGFEAAASATSYEENGVRVTYEGIPTSGGIWTTSQAAEGRQSWYANGGGLGYTRLQFKGPLSTFQFSAGSGWPGAETRSSQRPHLQFRIWNNGEEIAGGVVGFVPYYTGFQVFGFSGVAFDELHLQSLDSGRSFDEGGLDALTLDSIAFGGNVIPEPATWAMMVLGFGTVGWSARRRKAVAASRGQGSSPAHPSLL